MNTTDTEFHAAQLRNMIAMETQRRPEKGGRKIEDFGKGKRNFHWKAMVALNATLSEACKNDRSQRKLLASVVFGRVISSTYKITLGELYGFLSASRGEGFSDFLKSKLEGE